MRCQRKLVKRLLYTISNKDVPSFFIWIQNLDLGLDENQKKGQSRGESRVNNSGPEIHLMIYRSQENLVAPWPIGLPSLLLEVYQ